MVTNVETLVGRVDHDRVFRQSAVVEILQHAADAVIDTVTRYAPNFKRSVIGRMVLTPLDLERTYGLTEGNIFHGELSLEQLFFLRPAPLWARYETPIRNLWLAASGAHPGGGVTGAPGHNAAREILRDFRRKRLG